MVMLLNLLARLIGHWFVDREVEAADTTVADLIVGFSVAVGVVVAACWLYLRF
jgi:uncharacterized membrane protein YjfL (UPF0719 family)